MLALYQPPALLHLVSLENSLPRRPPLTCQNGTPRLRESTPLPSLVPSPDPAPNSLDLPISHSQITVNKHRTALTARVSCFLALTVSQGRIGLFKDLLAFDKADGFRNLCHPSGSAEDAGFSALAVLPTAGCETSSQPHGEHFSRMFAGSSSLERPRGVHYQCLLGNSCYEENSDKRCLVDRMAGCFWGGSHEWHLALEAPPCAYKISRADGCLSGFEAFLPLLRNCHVLVRTDNTTAVVYINHQGRVLQSFHPHPERLALCPWHVKA